MILVLSSLAVLSSFQDMEGTQGDGIGAKTCDLS